MTGGVDQAERPGLEGPTPLLAEAARVSDEIRSAASSEAADLLAAATRHAERVVELADRQVIEVRETGQQRARAVRMTAASDAEAELQAAGRHAREVALAGRRAGRKMHDGAHERATQILATADRRAEELIASARAGAADVEASALESAGNLCGQADRQGDARLAAGRLALADATSAKVEAERDATSKRETAAQTAVEMAENALLDLELARRLRTFARRDASETVAHAMHAAARHLDAANREFDVANGLLAEAQRGPRLLPARGAAPVGAVAVGELTQVGPPTPPPELEAPPEGPAQPLLVPVLSFGRELVLRALVFAGAVTAAWFWLWWVGVGHGQWTLGSLMATVLLGWLFGLSSYFVFFICRMSRPNPDIARPELRVAMVVTKAPAEAWDVVRRTIEAMLVQDYGRPYDVWLADERPSLETLEWCLERGVKVSSRHGVADYHQPMWPRRTKSKEGNLAYFYDQVGYEAYDVVVQLDADHVPTAGYLDAMTRPFVDPGVGYVCAPSICGANAEEGWTVRGRLYREASMHGPVQAGCNGGYAPVCIGSHYAVRTAALRDVGGLGPELAEDYSTTLWLQSAGWDGVFTIDAAAHGDGPDTVEEMLVQELQWSRSLCTILVHWAPDRLGTVPWRARLRLAFALLYYPLQGTAVAVATIAPLAGVLLRTPWGNTSLAGFYLHIWPSSLVALATLAYLRHCSLLRPVKVKVWSWELLLFQLVRWPWTLGGVVQGVYAGLRSRVVNFRVTPKAVQGPRPLSPRYVAPTLVLGLVPAWVVVGVRHPGPALGLLLVCALQALTYLSCACAVVVLHLAANRRRRRAARALTPGIGPPVSSWQAGWTAGALVLGLTAPTIAALIWRLWAVGLRA